MEEVVSVNRHWMHRFAECTYSWRVVFGSGSPLLPVFDAWLEDSESSANQTAAHHRFMGRFAAILSPVVRA